MQSVSHRDIEDIVQRLVAHGGAAGAGAAVLTGKVIQAAAAGWANAETRVPMTGNTLVQIGSTTKVLNAAIVMSLVQEGALHLDRPVSEVIPDLRLADEEAARALTLRHLLTMTSGIDNGPYTDFEGGTKHRIAQYVRTLHDMPQIFRPGTGFGYSNASSVIAGHAAQVATGKSWDQLLRERILAPAGMSHTETDLESLLFHSVSMGHERDGALIRPWGITRAIAPAGSTCVGTAADLLRFAYLFLNEGKSLDGQRVLTRASVDTMVTAAVEVPTQFYGTHWCAGPYRDERAAHVVLGHPGGNRSGLSQLVWIPDLDTAIAVVCNTPSATEAAYDAVRELMQAAGFNPAPLLARQPDEHRPIANKEQLVGRYENASCRYDVFVDGERLRVRFQVIGELAAYYAPITTTLLPVDRNHFVAQEPFAPGAPRQPIVFAQENGQAAHVLLDAVKAARRVRQ